MLNVWRKNSLFKLVLVTGALALAEEEGRAGNTELEAADRGSHKFLKCAAFSYSSVSINLTVGETFTFESHYYPNKTKFREK